MCVGSLEGMREREGEVERERVSERVLAKGGVCGVWSVVFSQRQ